MISSQAIAKVFKEEKVKQKAFGKSVCRGWAEQETEKSG